MIMKQHWIQKILFGLTVGLTTAIALPVAAAERVSFWYGALQLTLSVDSIATFITEGKVSKDLEFYTQYLRPDDFSTWREFLKTRLDIDPATVAQFTYSPVGEQVLIRLGEVFQIDPRLNGFHALRSALILAAGDRQEGLTILNILRRFPSYNLRLDVGRGLDIANNVSELIQKKGAVVSAIQKTSEREAANFLASSQFNSSSISKDLRQEGTFKWQKRTLDLSDRLRNRNFKTDLYLPISTPQSNQSIPLIIISHGIGEDRESFAYLARHLASQGFAVAALQHPGSDANKFRQYLSGLSTAPEPMELINQPLDVRFLLDELQRSPNLQLNLQRVGLIGHSQGGYAILALAGAKLNFPEVQKACKDDSSLNLALFVQCTALKIPQMDYLLQDPRVKAAIAINPVSSSIFGQQGISQIQVPTMIVASSDDVFTPIVPEQVRPFTYLTQPDKYLVMIENGTHFSVLQPTQSSLQVPIPINIVGSNPELARSYLNALGLAFFQKHLNQDSTYDAYLSPNYVKSLSQSPLNLSLVKVFTADNLAQALR